MAKPHLEPTYHNFWELKNFHVSPFSKIIVYVEPIVNTNYATLSIRFQQPIMHRCGDNKRFCVHLYCYSLPNLRVRYPITQDELLDVVIKELTSYSNTNKALSLKLTNPSKYVLEGKYGSFKDTKTFLHGLLGYVPENIWYSPSYEPLFTEKQMHPTYTCSFEHGLPTGMLKGQCYLNDIPFDTLEHNSL